MFFWEIAPVETCAFIVPAVDQAGTHGPEETQFGFWESVLSLSFDHGSVQEARSERLNERIISFFIR